jgi:phage FluMu protein Com
MAIVVTCTKCKKSFKVSDKFAGQKGPCPACKTILRVPTKEEQITVHAPVVTDAERTLKPILRAKMKLLEPTMIVTISAISLAVVFLTWIAGGVLAKMIALRGLGLLVISPPLVVAAYTFLRNDELEPYEGNSLWTRASFCGLGYVVLWGIFGYVSGVVLTGELWEWMFVAPPILAIGAMLPLACLDLDYGAGFFHYSFYLLVTSLLRWVGGMGWVWDIRQSPML